MTPFETAIFASAICALTLVVSGFYAILEIVNWSDNKKKAEDWV